MTKNSISNTTKGLLVLSALLLLVAIFVPIWQIELTAPQYPEGLVLKIYADKIAGDVEIINGLNHYIGMKTLHTNDFFEFDILPYLIGLYAVLMLISAITGSKKWLVFSLISFVLFGVIAMVDFWQWEYNYGHNLNPKAAIVVPGMAYQPPLIGFKQLLNFGAYSIPDLGGWCFIVVGILLFIAVLKETRLLKYVKIKNLAPLIAGLSLVALASCGNAGPEPIVLNRDKCDYCRMTISDVRFAAEVITSKGRIYKFDDLHCLQRFVSEKEGIQIRSLLVSQHADKSLIDATKAWYIKHMTLKSPMGGNMLAFRTEQEALKYASELKTSVLSWNELNK